MIARDLADAAIPALSADRRFATAYNAVLQIAKIAIACAGYRVASGVGHHQNTFEAARTAVVGSSAKFLDYFEVCRRKRNQIDYIRSAVATKTEAAELLENARKFDELVEKWISANHPKLQR